MSLIILFALRNIYSESRLRTELDQNIVYHFMAVFTPNTDVALGKTILVNETHQYGLYPHILSPIFAVIGFSVLKLTAVFTALIVVSLIAFYLFTKNVLKSNLAALLVFCMVMAMLVLTSPHVCYSFYPVRTFFPFVVSYLLWKYLQHLSVKLYFTIMVLSSIGVLWNMDAGAVLFATWLITVSYIELRSMRTDWRKAIFAVLKHWIIGISTLAGCVLMYALFAYMRSGHFPNFKRMMELQEAFYLVGFGMMPMPLVGTWNLLAMVYGFGLSYSIAALFTDRTDTRPVIVFFLSIFGCGIFSYYQGRSHPLVITVVLYPAIILTGIFMDQLMSEKRSSYFSKIALIPILYVFCLTFVNIFGASWNGLESTRKFLASAEPASTSWPEEYLKNSPPAEEGFFITGFNGLYMLHLNKPTPVDVMSELLLKRNEDDLLYWMEHAPPRSFVLIQKFMNVNSDKFEPALKKNFTLEATSPDDEFKVYRSSNKAPNEPSESSK